MLNDRFSDERGFTLVEGMVGAFILLVGILGAIGVFEGSGHASATGERQQYAADRAQAELERLRDLPYSELAINSTASPSWQPSGQDGDPFARVGVGVGGARTFAVRPGANEEMVLSAAGGRGIAPYTSEPALSPSAAPLKIYRFVSWRDEDCEVAPQVSNLTSGLSGSLANLGGTTPSLIDGLLGPGSLLGSVIGLLTNGVLRSQLQAVQGLLNQTRTALNNGLTGLNAAIARLDGLELDPCDMDLSALRALEETRLFTAAVSPALQTLDSALAAYHSRQCLPNILGIRICNVLPSPELTNLTSALTNVQGLLNPTSLTSTLNTLTASLNAIQVRDHDRNTKRITIAVVLAPRGGSGPTKPVWATSVVSDPNETAFGL